METIYQKIGNQESLNFVRTRSVMKMPISKIAMYGKGKLVKRQNQMPGIVQKNCTEAP